MSCASLRPPSQYALAGRRETRQLPGGGTQTGRLLWWEGASCPGGKRDLLEAAILQRLSEGRDPLPDCPPVDVAGVTCLPRWYPEDTLFADGSAILQQWVWSPDTDKGRSDPYRQAELWHVEFTPAEWAGYVALSDDNQIRRMDAALVIAIYYSLLQWQCVGRLAPVLEPSIASPQSLKGRHDSGHQHWLEWWERSLRERIWTLRPDLRQIRMPDGSMETGLRPPREIEIRPACTSQAGQIILMAVGAVTSIASLALSWPAWVTMLYQIPQQLSGFWEAVRAGRFAAKAGAAVAAGTYGTPVDPGTPGELAARAAGQSPGAGVAGGAGGSLIPLLIIAATLLA